MADASDGSIQIDVTASGAVVEPFETFEAVQSGVADMFHSHVGYFRNLSPAFHFFSAVPYGLTATELQAWVLFGGGQELWDALGADLNIKPLLCCSTGPQMGGWFLKEITAAEDFKGMRYRMAGYGAEVYRRLGAIVVLLPAADIVSSLRTGAIDACEWIGPWLDMEMGLHQVAPYYYYPGWHEPGAGLTLGINLKVWDGLTGSERSLLKTAAASEYARSLAEFTANNGRALRTLTSEHAVELRTFDEELLRQFAELSRDILTEAESSGKLARSIFRSYYDFFDVVSGWSDASDGAFLQARRKHAPPL